MQFKFKCQEEFEKTEICTLSQIKFTRRFFTNVFVCSGFIHSTGGVRNIFFVIIFIRLCLIKFNCMDAYIWDLVHNVYRINLKFRRW